VTLATLWIMVVLEIVTVRCVVVGVPVGDEGAEEDVGRPARTTDATLIESPATAVTFPLTIPPKPAPPPPKPPVPPGPPEKLRDPLGRRNVGAPLGRFVGRVPVKPPPPKPPAPKPPAPGAPNPAPRAHDPFVAGVIVTLDAVPEVAAGVAEDPEPIAVTARMHEPTVMSAAFAATVSENRVVPV
jgi:hypothetical protein